VTLFSPLGLPEMTRICMISHARVLYTDLNQAEGYILRKDGPAGDPEFLAGHFANRVAAS